MYLLNMLYNTILILYSLLLQVSNSNCNRLRQFYFWTKVIPTPTRSREHFHCAGASLCCHMAEVISPLGLRLLYLVLSSSPIQKIHAIPIFSLSFGLLSYCSKTLSCYTVSQVVFSSRKIPHPVITQIRHELCLHPQIRAWFQLQISSISNYAHTNSSPPC